MTTDYDTDEYDIDFEESIIPMSLNGLDLDYNIPLNFDINENQFYKTMQNNSLGFNTPANYDKIRPSKNKASTPYKVNKNRFSLWQG